MVFSVSLGEKSREFGDHKQDKHTNSKNKPNQEIKCFPFKLKDSFLEI